MTNRTKAGFLFTAAATGAIFFAACGDTTTPPTGGCTNDASCDSSKNEICHPVAKVCVQTCQSASDCPSTAKNCDALNSTDATKICKCSTDALCGTGNVCQVATSICTAKCTGNSDCSSGYSCDTSTGQCKSSITTDAGMDAGVGCTYGSCGTGKVCDVTAGTCGAKACVGTNNEPDTCGYGNQCSGIICTEVSKGSCGNIQSGSTPTTWGLSSTGPVIYDVSKVVFEENTTFCPGAGASKRVKVQIKAYDPAGRLLGEAMQPSFKYVRTDGQELTLGATSFQDYTFTNSGKNATFSANLCAPTGVNSIVVAFYYENGNPVCYTVQ